MKRITILRSFLSMMLLIICFACDKTEKSLDSPEMPTEPDNPSVSGVYTPTAVFDYLTQVGNEALGRFNPADQRDVLEVATQFNDLYRDYSFPDNFNDSLNLTQIVDALRQAIENNNPLSLTRAGYYDISIDDYTGIYEADPNSRSWVRRGESNSVVFRGIVHGQITEISINGERDGWILDSEDKSILIPSKFTTTFTTGGKSLSKVIVQSNYNKQQSSVLFNVNAEAANINVSSKISGDNSSISESVEIRESGQIVAELITNISGTELCNLDIWKNEEVIDYVSGVTNSLNVLGKVYVTTVINNAQTVFSALDDHFDQYSGCTQAEAVNLVKKDCNTLNSNVNVDIKFNGNNIVQASLEWQPYVNNNEWSVRPAPAVRYAYDGSTEFISSSNYNFVSLSSNFENLIHRYTNYIQSLR